MTCIKKNHDSSGRVIQFTPFTVPLAPENLVITSQETSALAVDWDDVAGAASYTVTVSQNNVQLFSNVTSLSQWTQTGLTAQTTYTITVNAVNAAGNGAESAVSSITGTYKIWCIYSMVTP